VRKALEPLQFVEQASIKADIKTKRVTFDVVPQKQLDLTKIKDGLEKQGFSEVKVLAQPKG
jgi:hypothetical protein